MDPDRFVFFDESAITARVARLCGWAPRSERLRDVVEPRRDFIVGNALKVANLDV